jgi:selenocysteine-specific elongation factor
MAEVTVFLETRELLGRVALIGPRLLKPGETAFAQLRLGEDVPAFVGERFIVRQQSPPLTIGGGGVLDIKTERFKTADIPARQALLEKRKSLTLPDLILSEVEKACRMPAAGIVAASPFPQKEIDAAVKELVRKGKVMVSGQTLVDAGFWQDSGEKLLAMAKQTHETDKLKKGLLQAEAQSALGLEKELFDALVQNLTSMGKLVRLEDSLALPGHSRQLTGDQEKQAAQIKKMFQQNPAAPPTIKEIAAEIPAAVGVVKFLVQQGELVELPDGVLMTPAQFTAAQNEVMRLLKEKGQVTIQDLNARFGYSRKFSIPILTHLDRLGITRREGDVRVAGKKIAG